MECVLLISYISLCIFMGPILWKPRIDIVSLCAFQTNGQCVSQYHVNLHARMVCNLTQTAERVFKYSRVSIHIISIMVEQGVMEAHTTLRFISRNTINYY